MFKATVVQVHNIQICSRSTLQQQKVISMHFLHCVWLKSLNLLSWDHGWKEESMRVMSRNSENQFSVYLVESQSPNLTWFRTFLIIVEHCADGKSLSFVRLRFISQPIGQFTLQLLQTKAFLHELAKHFSSSRLGKPFHMKLITALRHNFVQLTIVPEFFLETCLSHFRYHK